MCVLYHKPWHLSSILLYNNNAGQRGLYALAPLFMRAKCTPDRGVSIEGASAVLWVHLIRSDEAPGRGKEGLQAGGAEAGPRAAGVAAL
jgi:hypothetical protein